MARKKSKAPKVQAPKASKAPRAKPVQSSFSRDDLIRMLIGMAGLGLGILALSLSIIGVIVKACMTKR